MYIGHYAVALGIKKAAPEVSLGTLFFAAMITDLLMSLLVICGVEHIRIVPGITAMVPLDLYDYAISHSLATSVAWSLIIAALYYFFKRSLPGALVIGTTVFSHWVLDLITHIADIPLFPGSTIKVGLGLWNHAAASVLVEGLLFAAGMFLYLRATKAKDTSGVIAFWALMAFLACTWIASMYAPTPPDPQPIVLGTQMQWFVILAAYWADRHREPRVPVPS
jgi:hypothetical protein